MFSTIQPVWPRLLAVCSLLYLVLCGSCMPASQVPPTPSIVPINRSQANAELLFIKGDFDNALLEFTRIYDTAPTAEEHNQALYGLACTQMVMARTGEEMAEAIGNLQRWDTEKGYSPFTENRRLLSFALKRQGDFLKKKNEEQIQLEIFKNNLIAQQEQKIAQMTKTLERLQKQLEALEAIDENIQEKKRTL